MVSRRRLGVTVGAAVVGLIGRHDALASASAHLPVLWQDGQRDDSVALGALLRGERARSPDGKIVSARTWTEIKVDGTFYVRAPIRLPPGNRYTFNALVFGIDGYRPEIVA